MARGGLEEAKKKHSRIHAYQSALTDGKGMLNEAGRIVMADLAAFCRFDRTSVQVSPKDGHVDALATCICEGRREVFNRIRDHLKVNLHVLTQQITEAEHGRLDPQPTADSDDTPDTAG